MYINTAKRNNSTTQNSPNLRLDSSRSTYTPNLSVSVPGVGNTRKKKSDVGSTFQGKEQQKLRGSVPQNKTNARKSVLGTPEVAVAPTRIFPDADGTSYFTPKPMSNAIGQSPVTSPKRTSKPKQPAAVKTGERVNTLEYLSRPKRINEFRSTADDDNLIRINTEHNRHIPMIRSKSLPFNSTKLKSNLKKAAAAAGEPRPELQRSKSVHFEETLPIKYFHLEESPLLVSRHNSSDELICKINFDRQIPLGRMQLLSVDSDDDDDGDASDDEPDGFYDLNFAILKNNGAPGHHSNMDLKLNIFVNSKLNKNIILQSMRLVKRKMFNNTNDYFIWGKVLVKNYFFEKLIYIRYTLNDWESYSEVRAKYLPTPPQVQVEQDRISDGDKYDTFEFSILNLKHLIANENEHRGAETATTNNQSEVGGTLKFCIRYETYNPRDPTERYEFWGNNSDKNYSFRVVLHDRDTVADREDTAASRDGAHSRTNLFNDKYYSVANELGSYNRKTNKLGGISGSPSGNRHHTRTGSSSHSLAVQNNQRSTASSKKKSIFEEFLRDAARDQDHNDSDDDYDGDDLSDFNFKKPINKDKYWFHNELVKTSTLSGGGDQEPRMTFRNFRNPFAG
ncbi:putative protein phosphatase regulator PIG2 KNAG_0D01700 [Huiozyma naganishii CBS 8797]|uniref:CBM21 domain-containing protein n=1 Tax=Huiozyma naganishii (strain ATCC MYA-139 / BCRC 22969 / CBS 8797 / KCTC 17520 / NBRC 10181 / NCYC 3082 / Yp74L-3) TaxID=1071383 RepID=J7S6R9_HUIN7|nr:hypothetical protein KNAG_0D01700 [Kazachstania naganishii CBS 8797]CCK69921.1 hypothetical protein KNAG_0D01700 [Kazachstania naganishii CBS 8797]